MDLPVHALTLVGLGINISDIILVERLVKSVGDVDPVSDDDHRQMRYTSSLPTSSSSRASSTASCSSNTEEESEDNDNDFATIALRSPRKPLSRHFANSTSSTSKASSFVRPLVIKKNYYDGIENNEIKKTDVQEEDKRCKLLQADAHLRTIQRLDEKVDVDDKSESANGENRIDRSVLHNQHKMEGRSKEQNKSDHDPGNGGGVNDGTQTKTKEMIDSPETMRGYEHNDFDMFFAHPHSDSLSQMHMSAGYRDSLIDTSATSPSLQCIPSKEELYSPSLCYRSHSSNATKIDNGNMSLISDSPPCNDVFVNQAEEGIVEYGQDDTTMIYTSSPPSLPPSTPRTPILPPSPISSTSLSPVLCGLSLNHSPSITSINDTLSVTFRYSPSLLHPPSESEETKEDRGLGKDINESTNKVLGKNVAEIEERQEEERQAKTEELDETNIVDCTDNQKGNHALMNPVTSLPSLPSPPPATSCSILLQSVQRKEDTTGKGGRGIRKNSNKIACKASYSSPIVAPKKRGVGEVSRREEGMTRDKDGGNSSLRPTRRMKRGMIGDDESSGSDREEDAGGSVKANEIKDARNLYISDEYDDIEDGDKRDEKEGKKKGTKQGNDWFFTPLTLTVISKGKTCIPSVHSHTYKSTVTKTRAGLEQISLSNRDTALISYSPSTSFAVYDAVLEAYLQSYSHTASHSLNHTSCCPQSSNATNTNATNTNATNTNASASASACGHSLACTFVKRSGRGKRGGLLVITTKEGISTWSAIAKQK